MRRRPDFSISRRLLPWMLAVFATALASGFDSAHAQAGAGAERYEVTITPPKRPGSEPPADAALTPPATGEAAGVAAAPASETAAPAGGSQPASSSPPAAASDSATARATANLPLRTLQVGAYRQRSRAEQLQEALSPTFDHVDIVEVQSGGEPLYRVNVGRAPRGPGLEDLKRRLATAGFPAFEVLAPAAASKD